MTEPAAPQQKAIDSVAVVIVTYDSAPVLDTCLRALKAQSRRADVIVIVDNDSPDAAYLERVPQDARHRVIRNMHNEGYAGANNTGYALVRYCRYVLFLNPDAFPAPGLLEQAVQLMGDPEARDVGCLTGTLLGFDPEHQQPTGLIDSTGIFQSRLGRWRDRGRGERWIPDATGLVAQDIPAACGALMFCRTEALEDAALAPGEIFDSRFFMYKEDIELSLRLRRHGWRLRYAPELLCYHCRGWQHRQSASYRARYLSARNELRVCAHNRLRGFTYSVLKYLFVLLVERWLYRSQAHIGGGARRRKQAGSRVP
ncbi:MAG TPA: glycosyltransferase family 2 protein [Steroidobacteraceae bacterium]|nr:glycosyltransferase family 2 protein [Steroidobacteraceae bacterium]